MLKAVGFILLAAAIIIVGLWSITNVPIDAKNPSEPLPMEIHYEERRIESQKGVPAAFHIPSLYLHTTAEQKPLDASGILATPTYENYVSWYAESKRLNENGATIIVGNFDLENGNPGPFYHLASLQKNDIIELSDLNGKKYQYVVVDKNIFDWNTTKINTLMKEQNSNRLLLLTYPAHSEENKNQEAAKVIISAIKK